MTHSTLSPPPDAYRQLDERNFDARAEAGDETQITIWLQRSARTANLASVSALSAFQRQMDRYPQLDPHTIEVLFRDIRAGEEAFDALAASRKLSARRRRQLDDAVRRGDRAVEAVAGSTFRLVLVICRELAEIRYGRERAADTLGDLVGEANIALMEAIRDFDPGRGPSFPTYAARVIRNKVRYVLLHDGMMRSTASWARMRRVASIRIPLLSTRLGRNPTDAEIRDDLMEYCMEWAAAHLTAEEAKLPDDAKRERMVVKLTKQGMIGALNHISQVVAAAQPIASLDAPIAGTDGAYLGDMISSDPGDATLDQVELGELADTLAAALADLTEREQRIIALRYGLGPDTGDTWTYQEIGAEFGVTPERIRQIERKVLNKLRAPGAVRDKLAGFLPGLDGVDLDARFPGDT